MLTIHSPAARQLLRREWEDFHRGLVIARKLIEIEIEHTVEQAVDEANPVGPDGVWSRNATRIVAAATLKRFDDAVEHLKGQMQ